jgi:hypothetical protein
MTRLHQLLSMGAALAPFAISACDFDHDDWDREVYRHLSATPGKSPRKTPVVDRAKVKAARKQRRAQRRSK